MELSGICFDLIIIRIITGVSIGTTQPATEAEQSSDTGDVCMPTGIEGALAGS